MHFQWYHLRKVWSWSPLKIAFLNFTGSKLCNTLNFVYYNHIFLLFILPLKSKKAIFQGLQLLNLNFPPKLFSPLFQKPSIPQWQFTSNLMYHNSLNLKSCKMFYFHWYQSKKRRWEKLGIVKFLGNCLFKFYWQ